jgi:hypothetical protein
MTVAGRLGRRADLDRDLAVAVVMPDALRPVAVSACLTSVVSLGLRFRRFGNNARGTLTNSVGEPISGEPPTWSCAAIA